MVTKEPSKTLTNAQARAYIESGADTCPWCGDDNFDGDGNVTFHGDTVTNTVSCHSCGGQWNDVYTLTGVDEVCPPDK